MSKILLKRLIKLLYYDFFEKKKKTFPISSGKMGIFRTGKMVKWKMKNCCCGSQSSGQLTMHHQQFVSVLSRFIRLVLV